MKMPASTLLSLSIGLLAIATAGPSTAANLPDNSTNNEARSYAVLSGSHGEFYVETKIPYGVGDNMDTTFERMYSYLAAHSSSGRYVQVGTAVGEGIDFLGVHVATGEYFYAWKDTSNVYHYEVIDGIHIGEFGQDISYSIWANSNGSWGAQVNTPSGGYTSQPIWNGDSAASTALAAIETTNCYTSYTCNTSLTWSFWQTFNNAWYRTSSTSQWNRWPSCTNDGTTNCQTYSHSGNLGNGSSVSFAIY